MQRARGHDLRARQHRGHGPRVERDHGRAAREDACSGRRWRLLRTVGSRTPAYQLRLADDGATVGSPGSHGRVLRFAIGEKLCRATSVSYTHLTLPTSDLV